MIIARLNRYIGLSDIPNAIIVNPEVELTFDAQHNIATATHKSQLHHFTFTQLPEHHASFVIVQRRYIVEYKTWCLSPYMVRHNDVEFWDHNMTERNRWQKYAQQIVTLLENIKALQLQGFSFTFFQ